MRVLGIDPGSLCTGYGILEEEYRVSRLVSCGVIRVASKLLPDRLLQIFIGIEKVISSYHPDAMAVEEVFHARNAKSALVLGHARGVALLAAAQAGIEVFEYPTRKVKQTVVGHGAADKEQVRRMVCASLGEKISDLDASDAVAVALCHLRWSGQKLNRSRSQNHEQRKHPIP